MSKFKVGDRVQIGVSTHGAPAELEGTTSVVVRVDAAVGDYEVNGWFYRDEELTLATPDPVNHPAHYQSALGIECIDAIRAALTTEEFRGYCKGNAIKYVWRERMKGGDESLGKAEWYLREAVK